MPRCPVCRIQADLIKYEGVPVYNCGSCGGYWMTQARLDLILATSLSRGKLGDS